MIILIISQQKYLQEDYSYTLGYEHKHTLNIHSNVTKRIMSEI